MSATRPSPRWKPWPMWRGNNLPQMFRWVDDSGPVDMAGIPGLVLRLRITAEGAPVRDFEAGVEPGFTILDEGDEVTRGFFSFQPSLDLTRDLPSDPAAAYKFEALYEGLQQVIGEGQIAIRAGDNPDA